MAIYPATPPEQEYDLRTPIARAWHERRRILLAAVIGGLLGLGVAFLLPKYYKATAVILPPEESDLLSNMSLATRALTKFPAFGVLGDYFTPADVFKAVLKSRTVQEEVVDRFDLQRVYKKKSREKTLKELRGAYAVKLAADGTISVAVEDRDPKRAAAMAMAFLEALDRYNIHKRNTSARRTREFLEHRVRDTDSLLRISELALRVYQETHHAVVPTTAVSAGEVRTAADLMARKIMLEVRLGVLRSYLSEGSDEIVQTRTELTELKERISTLPALQGELARMIRDAKVQEQLFLLLTAELEQSRIRETMDTPTVQILDRAVPPERHSRPRRLTVGIVTGFLTLLGAAFYFGLRDSGAPRAG